MKYLYESHFHTAEVSGCAHVNAQDAVNLYKNAGYSGVVVTDHFYQHGFENKYEGNTWQEKIDYYLRGYRLAKELATDDFAVILGLEARFEVDNDNDYLVYGLDEEFLYEHEWLTKWTLEDFKKLAEKNEITVIQAHPFRKYSTITPPREIDGIEIYNGNRRHDSSNDFAELWAKKHGFITTAGSDFHEYEDLARAGMAFDRFVTNSKEFRAELLSGRYELKKHN